MSSPAKGPKGTTTKAVNRFSTKRLGIMKASSRIFAAVIVASVVVSICLVTLNFLWGLRGFNSRVIAERTEARDTLKANVDNVESLQLSFQALEQDRINSQIVLDSLPSKYDYPALATSIERLVESRNLVLKSFSGDDISATAVNEAIQPEPIPIELSVSVEGTYTAAVDFIKTLEKTIRPMQVTSVDFSGTDDNLTMDLRITTYYQPGVDVDIETKKVE